MAAMRVVRTKKLTHSQNGRQSSAKNSNNWEISNVVLVLLTVVQHVVLTF